MGDLNFSVRLSADGTAYVGPVKLAREETEKLGQAARQAGGQFDASMKQSSASVASLSSGISKLEASNNAMIESWAKEAQLLGKTRSEVIGLEAARAGLTQAQQQTVSSIQQLHQAHAQEVAATKAAATATRESQAAYVALGATLGIFGVQAATALGRWSVEGVHAAAALKDLHDITGSSIERLSQLTNVAKVSGFSGLNTALERLSVGLSGTDAESQKAGKALAALGIQSRDPARAMQELAQKFSGYSDDVNKAAYANAIFGRGGEQLLPFLKDLAEQQGIVGTVTRQQAEEAQRLEQQMRLLSVQSGVLRDALLSGLVPALSGIVSQFNLARAAGLGYWGSLQAAGLDADANLTVVVGNIKGKLATLNDQKTYAAKFKGPGFVADLQKDVDELERKLRAVIAIRDGAILRNQGDNQDQVSRRFLTTPTLGPPPAGGGAGGKDAKQSVADYTGEIQKLNDEMAKLAGADGGYSHLIAANEKYQADLRAGKAINLDQARTLMQTAVAADQQVQEVKDLNDGWALAKKRLADAAEYESKVQDAISATTASIEALVTGLDLETKTMLLTNEQRERAIALSKLQKEFDDGLIPTQEALAEAIGKVGGAFDRRDYAAAMKKSLDEQAAAFKQTYDNIRGTIADDLTQAFVQGKNIAQAFLNSLKTIFAQTILRPVIEFFVSPLAGGLTSLVAGGAQASGGTLGNAGSLLSNASTASSLYSGGGGVLSAAAAGYAGVGAPASVIGASEAALYGGATAGSALGAGGIMAGLEAGLAAVPVAGWIALAGIITYGIFKGFDKGPANRTATFTSGAASLVPDPSRDAAFQGTSAFGNFGISKDHWLSPTDKNAGADFGKTLAAITTIDNTIAGIVGKDQTQLITDALANHSITVGLGKEHTDINASGGPGAILQDRYTTVVSTIDKGLGQLVAHFQGTGEELANFVVTLVSLHQTLTDGNSIIEDAQKAWDASQVSSSDKLHQMGEDLIELAGKSDGSSASITALAAATQSYKQAAVEAIVAIRALQQQLTQMFAATREHIEFAGLDKQATYDLYKSKGSTLLETISETDDPAVVNQLSQRINNYIISAFDLLDPEEQLAHKQEFLDDLNRVDTTVNDRLDTIGTDIGSDTAAPFAAVNEALTRAGAQFVTAADTITTAATSLNGAADKIVDAADVLANTTIPISLDLETSEIGRGNTG